LALIYVDFSSADGSCGLMERRQLAICVAIRSNALGDAAIRVGGRETNQRQ